MAIKRDAGNGSARSDVGPSRREFLVLGGSSVAGALIALYTGPQSALAASGTEALPSPFDAWIQIGSGGRIVLCVAKAEMGQGVLTSLSRLLAEELDVAWEQVDVQQALVNPERYDHLTVGSSSIRSLYLPLRRAGALARDLLLRAAAARWKVLPEVCRTRLGVIYGPSGQRLEYEQVAAQATELPLAQGVKLKSAEKFVLIGHSAGHVECKSKVDGSAMFGIDVMRPGMLHATILRCPAIGQALQSFDQTAASTVRGVHSIFPIPPVEGDSFTRGGIAVVACDSWAALQARRLLKPDWGEVQASGIASERIMAALRRTAENSTDIVKSRGDPLRVLRQGGRLITASFQLPFLAHATMEPMNATVHVQSDRVDAWLPTQNAADARAAIARVLNRTPTSVSVHQTLLGGGFGRRDVTDFAVEAAQISAAAGAPVKLLWTREDDIQFDRYRPAAVHVIQASLDKHGYPEAWLDKMSSVSIDSFLTPSQVRNGEGSEGGGARVIPYDVPAFQFEYRRLECPVAVGWWRSVSDSINTFVVECFIDELASEAKQDPLQYRLRLLPKGRTTPTGDEGVIEVDRLRRVLLAVAGQARWNDRQRKDRALGLACHYARGSYIATVAQVRVQGNDIVVQRLWAAVDCGTVINPLGVDAQISGALQLGCSAALYERVSLKDGRTEQSNFNTYRLLRVDASPQTEVQILPSPARPGGAGEIGVPPVAPSIANALFRATGRRFRSLPLELTPEAPS
jgi:isoquinoline 1-oxidoreductase subunit beta